MDIRTQERRRVTWCDPLSLIVSPSRDENHRNTRPLSGGFVSVAYRFRVSSETHL